MFDNQLVSSFIIDFSPVVTSMLSMINDARTKLGKKVGGMEHTSPIGFINPALYYFNLTPKINEEIIHILRNLTCDPNLCTKNLFCNPPRPAVQHPVLVEM
ncbi:hypothetical protein VP01_1722g2 [Puccinia sorghi]|uniref:Uncharacterized protein n=1 Tax=Puccinia sorghi TaxID=27349 RepID=A0A0L6VFG8_9BASI|nr:hypothetical protein VP01_1722g2 [Puccinia sorghi]